MSSTSGLSTSRNIGATAKTRPLRLYLSTQSFDLYIPINCYLVPLFCMTDVVDGYVIVLAPKERHRVEARSIGRASADAGAADGLRFGVTTRD